MPGAASFAVETPPPADGSDATRQALAALYPEQEPGTEIDLPPEATGLIASYDDWAKAEKAAKAAKEAAQNALCAILGTAESGKIGGQIACTWKHQHRDAHTVSASDFRVFRRTAPKSKKTKGDA